MTMKLTPEEQQLLSEFQQLTRDEAIAFHDSSEWKNWSPRAIGAFQLWQNLMCVPFEKFHAGVEALLGRPVWTHEFASPKTLQAEAAGKLPPPDMAGIVAKLADIIGRRK